LSTGTCLDPKSCTKLDFQELKTKNDDELTLPNDHECLAQAVGLTVTIHAQRDQVGQKPTARKDQNTYTVILGTVRKDDTSLDQREVQFVMVEVVASAGVHFFTPLRRILVVLVTVETRRQFSQRSPTGNVISRVGRVSILNNFPSFAHHDGSH
jgi:hypothetical protein